MAGWNDGWYDFCFFFCGWGGFMLCLLNDELCSNIEFFFSFSSLRLGSGGGYIILDSLLFISFLTWCFCCCWGCLIVFLVIYTWFEWRTGQTGWIHVAGS